MVAYAKSQDKVHFDWCQIDFFCTPLTLLCTSSPVYNNLTSSQTFNYTYIAILQKLYVSIYTISYKRIHIYLMLTFNIYIITLFIQMKIFPLSTYTVQIRHSLFRMALPEIKNVTVILLKVLHILFKPPNVDFRLI